MTFPGPVLENQSLAHHTTLGVGGPARYLATVGTTAEEGTRRLAAFLGHAREESVPVLVLGGGSNVLVADEGFAGLVIKLERNDIEVVPHSGDTVVVAAAAGARWDDVVAHAVDRGLWGVECLSGIPGRAGAAPIQNIGAYGQELADCLHAVLALDTRSGSSVRLDPEDCGFGYRRSLFKGPWQGRYVVTGIELKLHHSQGQPALAHPELCSRLPPGEPITLASVRGAVLALRRARSMLNDPADPNHRSAGSFFLNPRVPAPTAREVEKLAETPTGRDAKAMPQFATDDGEVKLSAAWLIEQSGFHKGLVHGNAGISSRHCLAIINRGGARAAEILSLAKRVRAGVLDRFGVPLEPEPVFVGFDRPVADLLTSA